MTQYRSTYRSTSWDSNLRSRALDIEERICCEYADPSIDAADLALAELHIDSNRTDAEIAGIVAQKILQS